MYNISVTAWRRGADVPADEFGELPWRASATCPFTGELVRAAGDSESAAVFCIGRAISARIRKHCLDAPHVQTLEIGWNS